jgi:hypothetical protein
MPSMRVTMLMTGVLAATSFAGSSAVADRKELAAMRHK